MQCVLPSLLSAFVFPLLSTLLLPPLLSGYVCTFFSYFGLFSLQLLLCWAQKMKWSMDLNCALIGDIACTWLWNLKYSVLSQTSNVFYKPSQIKGLNCVLLHLFLQPLHSLCLCHKRMLHLPAWELLWTCYTRKRSSSWTLMLFLSIFGNNLHLKDRKHDCLKVWGINALDVCLLNEKGRWLFSTTKSSLQMSWS